MRRPRATPQPLHLADLLVGYRALAQLVRTVPITPVSRDPDDDHVLACALAAGATLIVTRDEDLLTLDPFRTIRVLPARAALVLGVIKIRKLR